MVDDSIALEQERFRGQVENRVVQIAKQIDPRGLATRFTEDTNAEDHLVEIYRRDDGRIELMLVPQTSLAVSIGAVIAGAGMARRQHDIQMPQVGLDGMVFGSDKELALCLNTLARDQSQFIEAPSKGGRAAG